jgi:hypothetical protein
MLAVDPATVKSRIPSGGLNVLAIDDQSLAITQDKTRTAARVDHLQSTAS